MSTFIIQVQNGKIGFLSKYNKQRFEQYLRENNGMKMSIKPVAPKVSDRARGYYYGAVIPFLKTINASWSNLTSEQLHEVLKAEFNGFEVTGLDGSVKRYGQSICNKDVDSPKFQNYLLRIADYVMENFNQMMPDPEEYKAFIDSAPLR